MFLLNKDFRTMEHYRNSLFGRFYILCYQDRSPGLWLEIYYFINNLNLIPFNTSVNFYR